MIKNSKLVQSALPKWGNMDYLRANLPGAKLHVVKSSTNKFKYWDEKKLVNVKGFKSPTIHNDMSFDEFLSKLKSTEGQTHR